MESKSGVADSGFDDFLESPTAPTPAEEEATVPLSLLYSEGSKYLRLHQYKLAIDKFNIVLGADPSKARVYMERSKAHSRLYQFTKAREDAMAAVNLWPTFSEAIDMKGTSEYLMGDFEAGLITYNQGREARPLNGKFRIGKQLCEEAIANSMMPQSGKKVNSREIKQLSIRKPVDSQDSPVPRGYYKYERLAKDKDFLNQLLADKGMKSVHGICKEGVEFIVNTENFWALQNPLHTRRKMPVGRKSGRDSMLRHIHSSRHRCQYYLKNNMQNHCIEEGQKLVKVTDSEHPDLPPRLRMKVKAEILHLLGLAYGKQNKEDISLSHFLRELAIAQSYNDLVTSEVMAAYQIGVHYLKKEKYGKGYHYLQVVNKGLKSKEVEKCLKANQPSKRHLAEVESEIVLSEVEAAQHWAKGLTKILKVFVQESIINKAIAFLKFSEGVGKKLSQSMSTSDNFSTESSDDYYTADTFTEDSEVNKEVGTSNE